MTGEMTGEALRKRRNDLGKSQEEVAEAIGLLGKHRRQTISSWENGAPISQSYGRLLDVVLEEWERPVARRRRRNKQVA